MYELTSASMVTSAAGYKDMSTFINGTDTNLIPTILMVMSISIIFAAVLNIFLGKSYHKGVTKFKAKSGAKGSLIISYFTLAMILVLSISQLLKGKISILVFLASFIVTVGLMKIANKYKLAWMGEFVLAFALIIGMALSVFLEGIMV